MLSRASPKLAGTFKSSGKRSRTIVSNLHPLTRLVDKENILGEKNWNRRHVLLRNAVSVAKFVGEDEVQRIISMPLLRSPYFTVLKEGVWANPERVTRTEKFGDREVSGLADAVGIRQALEQGATLKLNQMEDWHQPTRALVREIEQRVPAELKAYMFYTPEDNTGMLPHRDGSHVLAVQIAGRKEWHLYENAGKAEGRPELVPDAGEATHKFVMDPGDVLYLPHGYPHAATARDGNSLHLTLTITEPGPLDLVEAFLETFTEDHSYLMGKQREMVLEDKADATVNALTVHAGQVDVERLVHTALGRMRRRIV